MLLRLLGRLVMILLVVSPVLAFAYGAFLWWADGNRLRPYLGHFQRFLPYLMALIVLYAFTGLVLLLLSFLPRRPPWRRLSLVMTLLSAAMLLACFPLAGLRDYGRSLVEREIGLENLVQECLALRRELLRQRPVGSRELSPHQDDLPPALDRLVPSYVRVEPTVVRVALQAGFEHVGYELRVDDIKRTWQLVWYDKSRDKLLQEGELEPEDSRFIPVASVRDADEGLQKSTDALRDAGIFGFGKGMRGAYGIYVPPSQARKAREVLKADAEKRGYYLVTE